VWGCEADSCLRSCFHTQQERPGLQLDLEMKISAKNDTVLVTVLSNCLIARGADIRRAAARAPDAAAHPSNRTAAGKRRKRREKSGNRVETQN